MNVIILALLMKRLSHSKAVCLRADLCCVVVLNPEPLCDAEMCTSQLLHCTSCLSSESLVVSLWHSCCRGLSVIIKSTKRVAITVLNPFNFCL